MTYAPLTESSVVDFVRSRGALDKVLGTNGDLEAAEVGDGNLNLVFLVKRRDDPEAALILKQALPYLRVAGADWPLTRDRIRIETAALRLYNELVPGRSPVIFDGDDEMSFVAMEYLPDHRIMRLPLMAGERLPLVADHLADFMAATHFATSDLALDGPLKKARVIEFMNPGLCELQEAFVFTNPYLDSAENHWNPMLNAEVAAIRADGDLKCAIALAKERYMTVAQGLLHGDFHSGSVMVTATDTRVIDPEFAFIGPLGHDIGTLLANLAIDHLAHEVHSPEPGERTSHRSRLIEMMTRVWTRYAAEFDRLWQSAPTGGLATPAYWSFDGGSNAAGAVRRAYLEVVLTDAARFGGCEILRRLMGIVSVPELTTIEDLGARAGVERRLIDVARAWLLEPVRAIGDMTSALNAAAGLPRGSTR